MAVELPVVIAPEVAPVLAPVVAPLVIATQPKPDPLAAVAPVSVEKPAIDRSVVNAVVAAHRGEIIKCFAEGKKLKNDIKGQLTIVLNVAASGVVMRPQVQSGLGAPMVAACVAKAVSRWTFPARPGGATAQVTYPFTLH